MANIPVKISDKEISVQPTLRALFMAGAHKLFLAQLAANFALMLKAGAEDAGLPIPKENREVLRKENPAWRMVDGKTWVEVQANAEDLLKRIPEIEAILKEAKEKNAAYAPKSFEAYHQEAEKAVDAEKENILATMLEACKGL